MSGKHCNLCGCSGGNNPYSSIAGWDRSMLDNNDPRIPNSQAWHDYVKINKKNPEIKKHMQNPDNIGFNKTMQDYKNAEVIIKPADPDNSTIKTVPYQDKPSTSAPESSTSAAKPSIFSGTDDKSQFPPVGANTPSQVTSPPYSPPHLRSPDTSGLSARSAKRI